MLVSSSPNAFVARHEKRAESRRSVFLITSSDVVPTPFDVSLNSYLVPTDSSLALKGTLSLNQVIAKGRSPSASHLRMASCPFLTVSALNFDLKWAATESIMGEKN